MGELIAPPVSSKREEMVAVTQKCVEAIHALHDLGR
jgi:1-acyl-sn-glycerol-3-phosphate acyltransferase